VHGVVLLVLRLGAGRRAAAARSGPAAARSCHRGSLPIRWWWWGAF